MHPQIQAIFDDAETRYLKPEELKLVTQYVTSLPERLEAYRNLREHEVEIVQAVADQLQSELPQAEQKALERSLKNALLMLRYCAMGMLLDDENFVKKRFLSWVSETTRVYNSEAIDLKLYQLLNQRLLQVLGSQQMNLLAPILLMAQKALYSQPEAVGEVAIGN